MAIGERMSEQTTATATRPPGSKAPGKKYAGLTRNQWFIVGGVFAAALGYILWKRHQAASAASSTTGATNAGSNECTDANGNPVDCNEQFAQELADMANALDQLQAQQGSGAGGTGVSGTVGTTPTTTTGAPATTQPSGTPTTSTGGTTATATKTAGAITGLKSSDVTKTSFKASWNAASNASGGYSYIVRDLASHTQTTQGKTNATSVTISGLKSGTDYNFGIQALPGGTGNNIHVRTT